jgi:hypothetical protein
MKSKKVNVNSDKSSIEFGVYLATELHKWMMAKYNPHTKIIIESGGVTITEDAMFIPLEVDN